MKNGYFAKQKIWTLYVVKSSSSSNHDKRCCYLTVCDERRSGATGNVMQWMNQIKKLSKCAELFVLRIYVTHFYHKIKRKYRLKKLNLIANQVERAGCCVF